MKFDSEKIWCGTEASMQVAVEAYDRAIELQSQGKTLASFEMEPVWHKAGATAVISIVGSLVNGSAGFMRLFGVIGYNDIRSALAEAVTDSNVKNILLDINSGGGQVSGLSDLGDFMQLIGRAKPIHTYADGALGSAAYWLGSIGKTVTITDTTLAGSIGAMQVHVERSKMMDEMGVKATIIRSGDWKGRGTAYEPLAKIAEEAMQSQVDDINVSFVGHVAKMRNKKPEKVEAEMGQGRVFLGQRAVDVGIADGVGNYEAALSALTDKNGKTGKRGTSAQANMQHNSENPEQGKHMKVTLSAAQLEAAIAAGVLPSDVEAQELTAEEQAAATAQATAAAAETAERAANGGKTLAEIAAEADNKPAANVAADFLRGELKDTQAALQTAQLALAEANGKVTAMAAASSGLEAIARKSLGSMKIALNEGVGTSATMTGDALVAEHSRVAAVFTEKFKAGGVAAVSTETAPVKGATIVNPEFVARLAGRNKA